MEDSTAREVGTNNTLMKHVFPQVRSVYCLRLDLWTSVYRCHYGLGLSTHQHRIMVELESYEFLHSWR